MRGDPLNKIFYHTVNVMFKSCVLNIDDEDEAATKCKDKGQLIDWLQDKYLIILENGHKFATDDWYSPVKKQSEFKFHKIATRGFFRTK